MDNTCAHCTNNWKLGKLCHSCQDVLGFRGGEFNLPIKVIKIYDLYKSTKEDGEKESCLDKISLLGYTMYYGDILVKKKEVEFAN